MQEGNGEGDGKGGPITRVEAPIPLAATPTINPRSLALASQLGRTGPVHERLLLSGERRQKKIDQLADQLNRRELELLRGVPQIDKHSEELLRQRRETVGGSPSGPPEDTVARLADYEVKRREERRKRLGEQYEAQVRQATAPVSFLSPSSKRLVERSDKEPPPPARAAAPHDASKQDWARSTTRQDMHDQHAGRQLADTLPLPLRSDPSPRSAHLDDRAAGAGGPTGSDPSSPDQHPQHQHLRPQHEHEHAEQNGEDDRGGPPVRPPPPS